MTKLPVYGHFHASLMDDPESIEMMAQQVAADKKKTVRQTMLGWTTEVSLLATIIDVLSEMHATLIQVNSKDSRRPSVSHVRRPASALDRIEAKQALSEHRQRVRAWTGKQ